MDEREYHAETDRMLERAVAVARGGDPLGTYHLLEELHARVVLWWEPGSDDVAGGRRVVRVRRQLCMLHYALGELSAALEVGALAVGAADLMLQAVDRVGPRPRDIVDEATWAALDLIPVVLLAVGDQQQALSLLNRAHQWCAPGPAERLRRVHGRTQHDFAAYLWGRMRQPAPTDQDLAQQLHTMIEAAGMAVGIRRTLRDPVWQGGVEGRRRNRGHHRTRVSAGSRGRGDGLLRPGSAAAWHTAGAGRPRTLPLVSGGCLGGFQEDPGTVAGMGERAKWGLRCRPFAGGSRRLIRRRLGLIRVGVAVNQGAGVEAVTGDGGDPLLELTGSSGRLTIGVRTPS